MKAVLITGASSGIGKEFAQLFAKDGYDLILVARNGQVLCELADRLQNEFSVSVRTIVKDLTQPAAPKEIYDELRQASLPVDILVNNAGVGLSGPFVDTDLTVELGMVQLNIVALTHLTKLFLRDMVKKGFGKILNVASTAAFQPGPLMAVYYATKAYVLSFSEALAEELRGVKDVTVSVLCPGLTASNFQTQAGIEQTRLTRLRMMNAHTVARLGYEGLMKNKTVIIPGLRNRLLAWGVRFVPRSWVTGMARWLHQ